MKIRYINVGLLPIFSLALVSCTKSGAPSCSNADVKRTAVELLTKGLPRQYLYERAASSECLNQAFSSLDMEQFDTLKVSDPCVNQELENARAYVAKVRSTGFTNVRTTSRDDSLKKSTCTADLADYHDIQFSAQFNEDGEIYVEVY